MTNGELPVRRRRLRSGIVVALALAALLAVAGYAAWFAWSAVGKARTLRTLAVTAGQQASNGDLAAAAASLEAASAVAADLRTSVSGSLGGLVSRLPGLGPSVDATQVLAGAAADVSADAAAVASAAAPLVEANGRTSEGAVDLAGIASLEEPLRDLSVSSAAALDALDGLDADRLPGPLAEAVTEGQERLRDLPGAASAAADTTAMLPGMLGADGPRRWLVVLQNLTEARGTGGIIGSYVVMTADEGRISVDLLEGNNAVVETPVPQDAMPEEFRDLWGSDPAEWSSFNLSLHYPYAARLAADGMAVRGVDVDGVIMLDQRAVAGILAGTGPVRAEGVILSAADAVEFLTTGAYAMYPDTARKDAVVNALLRATVEKALAGSVDPVAMVKSLSTPVSEGRVLVWSAEADEEEWLATMPVGGSLPDQSGPFSAVALNNGAGNKMDAYVSSALAYFPGVCPTAVLQRSRIEISLRNDAPALLPDYVSGRADDPSAPEDSTKMLVHVYGPVGAELAGATLDGAVQDVTEGEERGHPVWRYDVAIDRGQERSLVVEFTEPSVPGAEPIVVAQPMANPMAVSVTPDPACP